MMNLKIKDQILAIGIAGLMLSSCGKKIDEVTLKANSASVEGDLQGYVEVTSNEITLTPSSKYGKGLEAKVKFKILKPFAEMGDKKGIDHIGLNLLDNGGMPAPGLEELKFDGWCCYDDIENVKGLLAKGSGEFIAAFYMDTPYQLIGKDFKKILGEKEDKLKAFSISSVVRDEEKETASSNSSMNNEKASNAGSENWNKMLDDYDAYVTDYIKLYKKAMKGDQSAISEYPALMEKANALQESMQWRIRRS